MKETIKHCLGYMRCLLARIRKIPYKVYIGKNVHITNGKNITLGENIQIRPDCDLFAGKKFIIGSNCDIGTRNRIVREIVIEDDVLSGPDNYLSSYDHSYEDITQPIIRQSAHLVNRNGHGELKIGEGSWIGTHCAIIGDVHIGKHCVIGANSVVTKDVPDYCVIAGNPAIIIKHYDAMTKQWVKSY